MRKSRLASALLAAIVLTGFALPGRADQVFSTVKTGPLPSPGKTAAPGTVNIDYVYYPCQGYGRNNQCLCAQNQQATSYGNGNYGCRQHTGHHGVPHHPHPVNPVNPGTPPRYYPQAPAIPHPMPT